MRKDKRGTQTLSYKIKVQPTEEQKPILEQYATIYVQGLHNALSSRQDDYLNEDFKPAYAIAKELGLSSYPAAVLQTEVRGITRRYIKAKEKAARDRVREQEKVEKEIAKILKKNKDQEKNIRLPVPKKIPEPGYPRINPSKLRFGLFPYFKVTKEKDQYFLNLRENGNSLKLLLVDCEFHSEILEELVKRKSIPTSRLIRLHGEWYFNGSVSVKVSIPETFYKVLGIDLGLAKVATGYSPYNYKGCIFEKLLNTHFRYLKEHYYHLTRRYQKQGRYDKVRKMKRKGSRMMSQINHTLAKRIVEWAVLNGNDCIAMENLEGIARNVTRNSKKKKFEPLPKKEAKEKQEKAKKWNRRIHSWAFYELQTFVEYKAYRAGIAVIYVNPWKTSQTCSKCGYSSKNNRKGQANFTCKKCHFNWNADLNAAKNIAKRGLERQAYLKALALKKAQKLETLQEKAQEIEKLPEEVQIQEVAA